MLMVGWGLTPACRPLLCANPNLINNPTSGLLRAISLSLVSFVKENLMRRLITKLPNVRNYNVKRDRSCGRDVWGVTSLRTLYTYKPKATDTESLVRQDYLTAACPRARRPRLREKGMARKELVPRSPCTGSELHFKTSRLFSATISAR
ncbi:hypothetical protein X777_15513 [Ooceraea biroi]|uniref:Uncharacterized protein n=1 Tax=Ooceraea biroi TaxID=2015173 RepID=A0A026VV13_OOCBI|nr:hypothetical protein X777_15513 [Ooceraea biroi]